MDDASRPRKTRADGQRTRRAILHEAVRLSTLDGLEGLSIGNLASALGMSKSGLYAHFGSKEELQLAVVDAAGAIFRAEVVEPALTAPAGLGQLVAICEAFYDHLERRTLPGGCFFAGAVLEMGTRPGPVKERVAAFQADFLGLLQAMATAAIDRHELSAQEEGAALAFELNGLILAANARFVLTDGADGLALARTVTRRRLGVPSDAPACAVDASAAGHGR